MTDARLAFHALRNDSAASYDSRTTHAELEVVERRVERMRARRAVLTGVGVLALAGGIAVIGPRLGTDGPITPVHTPSVTPAPTATSTVGTVDELSLPCTAAVIVAGNPVGDLGGLEGWFNATADGQTCEGQDTWDSEIAMMAAHPATVLINTIDGTMIEAYTRVGIDALGIYATLTGDFAVPDADPDWPANSAVLIDARTGEVLEVADFTTMDNFDPETGEFDYSGGS